MLKKSGPSKIFSTQIKENVILLEINSKFFKRLRQKSALQTFAWNTAR